MLIGPRNNCVHIGMVLLLLL